MTLVLAGLDAVVGAYLIVYASRREHRGKDAVLVVGIILLVCAGVLSASGRAPVEPAPMGSTAAQV